LCFWTSFHTAANRHWLAPIIQQEKPYLTPCRVARSNTRTRLVAVFNGLTGKVTYLQRSKIGSLALQDFYQQVRADYLLAKRIYVVPVNDN
jgi:hypothetical protein